MLGSKPKNRDVGGYYSYRSLRHVSIAKLLLKSLRYSHLKEPVTSLSIHSTTSAVELCLYPKGTVELEVTRIVATPTAGSMYIV